MALSQFSQHPGDRLDYTIDMTKWLGKTDTLKNAEVIAEGLTTSLSVSDKKCVVWITGGESKNTYNVKVHFTTAEKREKEFHFAMSIVDFSAPAKGSHSKHQ